MDLWDLLTLHRFTLLSARLLQLDAALVEGPMARVAPSHVAP